MSKIDKLSIQGIRSFTPITRETIQFNTPLTLIVGYNGSGKTTIIECLKYATTGELPPNSKGGAFIHDPKLCGEREVLAQVKLSFQTNNGQTKYVVTRSLQLTVKKTTRTFKTLEGSLVEIHNGERNTKSSKVAKLDEEIPDKLGVSTAILDAVIFCHQDESLWPMSEPSVLKRRFDEIFAAGRYTKVIDNLKLVRKKQGESLSKLKLEEAQSRVTKEKGERAEKRSMALQKEIEDDRVKCQEIAAEMAETQRKQREAMEAAQTFLGIVNDLKMKNDALIFRQEKADDLKADMSEELHDSDEQLHQTLTHHDQVIAGIRREADQCRSKLESLEDELATARRNLSARLAEKGKLESDRDKYERQVKTRVQLVKEAARLHSIRGYDDEDELDDKRVRLFYERIAKLLAEKKRELDAVQRENEAEIDKATAEITNLETQKGQLAHSRLTAKQRIAAIDRQITVLQTDLRNIKVDDSSKAILEFDIQDMEERLRKENEEWEKAGWDSQIQAEEANQAALDAENERLNRELVESTRLASDRAQLDLRKKELAERQRRLETLTKSEAPRLQAILGAPTAVETIEDDYRTAMQTQKDQLDAAVAERDRAATKRNRIHYDVSTLKEKKEKIKSDIEKTRTSVLAALEKAVPGLKKFRAETKGDPTEDYDLDLDAPPALANFSAFLAEAEANVQDLDTDVRLFSEFRRYYGQCLRMLEKKDKCRLCDRGFDGQEAARTAFIQKLHKMMDDDGQEASKARLGEAKPIVQRLKDAQQDLDAHETFSIQLPGVEAELRQANAAYDNATAVLERHEDTVAELQRARQDLEEYGRTVQSIAQLYHQAQDSVAQIDRINSQQHSSAAGRSPDEIHADQAQIAGRLRTAKETLSRLQSSRTRAREALNQLELKASKLNSDSSKLAIQLERRKDFEQQIQTLRDESATQRGEGQRADEALEALVPDIANVRNRRDAVVQAGRAKEAQIADARDRLNKTVSELRMIDADIQDYVTRGGARAIQVNKKAIESLEAEIARVEGESRGVNERLDKLKGDIGESDKNRKNIVNNISWRKTIQQLATLRAEIAALEARNASEDYERLMREANGFENVYNLLMAERSGIMGSMKTKDEELGRLLEEWETDYKDAAVKYRESHIKVETTKAAIEDLALYGSALDKAVMRYHSLKMEEINRIAGELWQATYQGTDIDTILIRSDAETATGKRNYNYRVCMVKQDAEMDMRGRCSAGQKVLASIIIRLALAESFGINCGLIALDEPTTNLDSDNIRSLAASLHSIINSRQLQSNFQLIVITHDEEFLRHMQCSDFCDTFYRVSRDDRQNSVIQRESIAKIF